MTQKRIAQISFADFGMISVMSIPTHHVSLVSV
jgi:hypothetical protein